MRSHDVGKRGKVHHHGRAHGVEKQTKVAPVATPSESKGSSGVHLEATEEQGKDAVKRLGLDEPEGGSGRGGVGASQIAHNLAVIEGKTATGKLKAGITGMLLALALTFIHVAPAHAQETSQVVAPQTASLVVTQKTGPPSFLSSGGTVQLPELGIDERATVFGAQLHALKKVEVKNVDAAVQRALDQFGLAMTHALKLDAYGLASGGPLDPSRPLSDADQKAVQQALSNLLSEMPVGALAPALTEQLGALLREHGLSTTGLESKRLRDLGKPGGELIKVMAEELRHERPAVFYGTAAALAGAVGVVGYSQGTDALASLGLRPELKTKLFNDRLIAKVRAEWGARFSDPKLTTRVEQQGTLTLGGTPFTATTGLGVVLQGASFKQLELSGLELSGSMSGVLKNGGTLTLAGVGVGDPSKGLERVTLSGAYLNDPWTAGATVSYFAREERTVGQLSVGYRPQKNIDWSLVGTMDSKGEKYVGIGLRVGF